MPKPKEIEETLGCPALRPLYLGLGICTTALGILGMFLPLLPTTVFLLIALWAFSRSSPRLEQWLFNHPRFGRSLRDWHRHRVVPLKAKALAVTTMSASLLYLGLASGLGPLWVLAVALLLTTIASWLVTRPSEAPILVPGSPTRSSPGRR